MAAGWGLLWGCEASDDHDPHGIGGLSPIVQPDSLELQSDGESGGPAIILEEDCVVLEEIDGFDFSIRTSGPDLVEGRFSSSRIRPALGLEASDDLFLLRLFPQRLGAPLETGHWDLANTTPHDCDACILLYEDGSPYTHQRAYFQHRGTLSIDPASQLEHGSIRATLNDVVLVEYDMDLEAENYGPIPGGACLWFDGPLQAGS